MNKKTQNIIAYSLIGLTLISVTAFIIIQRRRAKGIRVRIKNKNPKKILIVGDSQSAIKTASGGNITWTYPNLLRDKFPNKEIDVLAIGGKTTSWGLDNLPSQLSDNKYDRVYIYMGGNDTSNSSIPLDRAIGNVQKMVDLSKENGADVFVGLGWKIEGEKGKFGNHNIMPLTRYLDSAEDWIPLVNRRRDFQKRLFKEIKGANFVPVYDLKQNTTDGIHPTREGHKLVADYYAKTLK